MRAALLPTASILCVLATAARTLAGGHAPVRFEPRPPALSPAPPAIREPLHLVLPPTPHNAVVSPPPAPLPRRPDLPTPEPSPFSNPLHRLLMASAPDEVATRTGR